jgi:acetylornithine and succinylornithine aminotransferases
MTNSEIATLGKENYMHTYGSLPIAFVKGEGCSLTDADGKEYIDMVAGIAVNALGYGNEKLKAALIEQINTGLLHTSNLYYNEKAVTAAAKLNKLAGSSQVFFCNSGAEANEAALKLARKFGSATGRSKVISMAHSFHGRTYGAITLTGQEKYHKGFFPVVPGITYAEFNNIESIKAAWDEETVAVIVEPVQGEGGVIKADPAFMKELRAFCDEKNLLLIFDEVQCGMGRTGAPFAFQNFGIKPDVLTLAKALGCGVPAGACLAFERAKDVFEPGNHAATFGGNYLAGTAANVILDYLADPAFISSVKEKGEYLGSRLEELKALYPAICLEVRGMGLMRGIQLSCPPAKAVSACIENGLLVCSAGYDVLRFVPPLVISKDEIDRAFEILKEVFSSLS